MKKILLSLLILIPFTASAITFGDGNIGVLDKWSATSSPVSGISPRTPANTIYAPFSSAYFKDLIYTGSLTNVNKTDGCASWVSGVLTSLGVACGSGSGGGVGTSTNPFMATYFVATSTTATSTFSGGLNIQASSTIPLPDVQFDYQTLVTTVQNLSSGTSYVPSDSGQATIFDTSVTGASGANTIQGYNFNLNGNPIISAFGYDDGTGFLKQTGVGISSSTPMAKLAIMMSTTTDPMFALNIGSSTVAFATTTLFSISNTGAAVMSSTLSVAGPITNQAIGNYIYTGNSTALLGTDGSRSGLMLSNSSGVYWNSSGGAQAGTKTASINKTTDLATVAIGTGAVDSTDGTVLTGFLGLSSSTPNAVLSIGNFRTSTANFPLLDIASTTNGTATTSIFRVNANSNVGVSTSSPGSLFSIGGIANFSVATSTFYSGLNILNGCYAHSGVCLPEPLGTTTNGDLIQGSTQFMSTKITKYTFNSAIINTLGATPTGALKITTIPANTIVKDITIVITGQEATIANFLNITIPILGMPQSPSSISCNLVNGDNSNNIYGHSNNTIATETVLHGGYIPSTSASTDININFDGIAENLNTSTECSGDIYITTQKLQ